MSIRASFLARAYHKVWLHERARASMADRYFHARHPIGIQDRERPHRLIRYKDDRDIHQGELYENPDNVLWSVAFDYFTDNTPELSREFGNTILRNNEAFVSHIGKFQIADDALKIVERFGDMEIIEKDLLLIMLYSAK